MYISSFSDDNSSKVTKSFDSLLKHTLCSFVRSQILFIAIRLNLFTMIDQSPTGSLSYEEMKENSISLTVLSYLVYLRLLKRCKNSNRYECTNVTRKYLVTSNENYVGLGIGIWDYRQYTFFLRFDQLLKTGKRISEEGNEEICLWKVFEKQSEVMIHFARIMSSFTRCTINELCDHVNFSSYSTLLDIGGSLGDLSRTIIKRYPHMNAFSFDLPEVTSYNLSLNLNDSNIEFISGSFFDEKWPDEINENLKTIDLVCLKFILHDWSYNYREYLINKIYKLLKMKIQVNNGQGNGTLLIIEKMIDSNRENSTTLSTSISMAIECGDGIGYDATQYEYEQLLIKNGFQRLQSIQLSGPMVAIFAHII